MLGKGTFEKVPLPNPLPKTFIGKATAAVSFFDRRRGFIASQFVLGKTTAGHFRFFASHFCFRPPPREAPFQFLVELFPKSSRGVRGEEPHGNGISFFSLVFGGAFFQKAPEVARRARIGVLKISEGCFGVPEMPFEERHFLFAKPFLLGLLRQKKRRQAAKAPRPMSPLTRPKSHTIPRGWRLQRKSVKQVLIAIFCRADSRDRGPQNIRRMFWGSLSRLSLQVCAMRPFNR